MSHDTGVHHIAPAAAEVGRSGHGDAPLWSAEAERFAKPVDGELRTGILFSADNGVQTCHLLNPRTRLAKGREYGVSNRGGNPRPCAVP